MMYITTEEDIQIDLPLQALYFYFPQMVWHQKFLTMIHQQEKNLPFFAIDVDQFSSQCKRFMITSVPTVVILKDGKEINRISGSAISKVFKSAFADICNS
jgi:thioredoxin family protein